MKKIKKSRSKSNNNKPNAENKSNESTRKSMDDIVKLIEKTSIFIWLALRLWMMINDINDPILWEWEETTNLIYYI